ncbi:levanase [Spiroplasma chinense]|uniref:Levanase n=1 Tax=Spiroplasma chinense TaxID=216932 RepID=A0A5B9Y438_9MOLU|nr:lipoprotein [Spiroplasma chinense]QEH61928.1 levanase [Spiroplasma chinense]
MRKILSLLAALTVTTSATSSVVACERKPVKDKEYIVPEINDELYTTVFHQQNPTQGMMNDIQGGYFDEVKQEWHVYFLQNEDGRFDKYGFNHGEKGSVWYHAITKDWINWENVGPGVPKTIENFTDQASGSLFKDTKNLFGLDKDYVEGQGDAKTLVAVSTNYNGDQNQDIMMFYSVDGGYSFTTVKDELILKNPNREKNNNFRDPFFFYNEETKHFVMYIARGDYYSVYASDKPTEGYKEVENGKVPADHPTLECSNLYQMNVKNEDGSVEKKWVLIYGGNGEWDTDKYQDNLTSGTYYAVGEMKGDVFVQDKEKNPTKRLDFGPDYYASNFYTKNKNNTDVDSLLTTGWMSNWEYNYQVPNDGRIGYMSLAREITLTKKNNDYVMETNFVDIWSDGKSKGNTKATKHTSGNYKNDTNFFEENSDLDSKAFKLDLDIKNLKDYKDSIKLKIGDDQYSANVDLDFKNNKITVKRDLNIKLAYENSDKQFKKARSYKADLNTLESGKIEIYLDKTTLEFKFPDGSVYTMLKFPDAISKEDIHLTTTSDLGVTFNYYQFEKTQG